MVQFTKLLKHVGRAPELIAASKQTPAFRGLISRYLEIGTPRYPFPMPLRSGGQLTLADRMEVKVFWQLFIHESYAIPANCKTILDCGANAGIFSVWAAKKCPEAKITALEPFPSTFAELQVNLKQNNLENRVRAVPFGLAASEGTRLIRTAGDSPDRRLVLDSTGQALAGTITVNCISLAQCLDRHQLATVDLMKMDIEGSEWEVLLSTEPSVLRRIKHIQLEYHEVAAHFGYTPEKLFAHLATAGHKLTYRDEDSNHTGIARFELAA